MLTRADVIIHGNSTESKAHDLELGKRDRECVSLHQAFFWVFSENSWSA